MPQYYSSKAIVLSAIRYGDNSRIVRLYTDQFGLISVLINSVSSKKSAVRSSMLLPLTLLEIIHTHKGDEKLDRIKEAKMDLTYTSIPYDAVRNAIALFLAELFGKVLREETENIEKFNFVRSACLALDTLENVPPAFHLSIWSKFSLYLGFSPDVNQAKMGDYFDLQDGQFLSHPSVLHPYLDQNTTANFIKAMRWSFEGPLIISRKDRTDLFEGLLQFMNIHYEGFGKFKSTEVLGELFS
ncbi:recombination protein O N-terminal domain-containing protein [Schleiferiaceae bacterium]|nr:recombination protein O N-terminal domain-containing protein [Schleiferiaceae bacterium]